MKKKLSKSHKGFVALFTVLIASVVLAMALGIANIALKQIVLSASANEANKSFYAADSGVECALAYDLGFAPSVFIPGTGSSSVTCDGGGVVIAETPIDASSSLFDFQVLVGQSGEYCANVTVEKTVSLTTIISKGQNSPCGQPLGPRTVERAIEVTY